MKLFAIKLRFALQYNYHASLYLPYWGVPEYEYDIYRSNLHVPDNHDSPHSNVIFNSIKENDQDSALCNLYK